MLIDTNLCTWLANAPCTAGFSLTLQLDESDSSDLISFPSHKKLKSFVSSQALGSSLQYLNKIEPILFEASANLVYAHILKFHSQELAYYTFQDDDKYFLVNSLGIGYQETSLYNEFYKLLPPIQSLSRISATQHDSLWIFPRAQYGHFIYDEVLPQFTAYYKNFGHPPPIVDLLSSRNWQYNVVCDVYKLIFNSEPNIVTKTLPSNCLRLLIHGGFHSLTYYPAILEVAKTILDANQLDFSSGETSLKIFLSREGFDLACNDRVSNRREITQLIDELGFITVKPHDYRLAELQEVLADARLILSESGTTPLIGYLCARRLTKFIVMASARCITSCEPRFAYSGWKYHLPWLNRTSFAWGRPVNPYENPFSDSCSFSLDSLRVLCHSHDN